MSRLSLCIEGDPATGGGGAQNAADVIALTRENEAFKTRLAALETDAATKATAAQAALETAKTEALAKAAELEGKAAKAEAAAKRHATLAHLSGIKNPDYLRLAPDVALDDNGALTAESLGALKKFRDDNAILFGSASTTTPQGGAGGTVESEFTPEGAARLAALRIDVKEVAKRPMWGILSGILGHNSKAKAAA